MNIIENIAIKILVLKGCFDVKQLEKNALNAEKVNEKLLMTIIKENKDSYYGKKYDFENIKTVEDYKKKVPIVEYKDIEKYAEDNYQNGTENLLTSSKVIGYAKSSGSIGKPKVIQKTKKDIKAYSKYTVTRFLYLASCYLKRTTGKTIKPGRGICLLAKDNTVSPKGLPSSNVADIAERKYEKFEKYILALPLGRQFVRGEIDRNYAYARFGLEEERCSYIFYVFAKGVVEYIEYIRDNWKTLVDEIEKGTLSNDVYIKDDIRKKLEKIVKPNPKRAAYLKKEFEKGFDETILKRIWPNLSVISFIGTSAIFEEFTKEVQNYSKFVPIDYSIYGASEGLMAAAYEVNNTGQLLLTDSCYYEFVEEDDEEMKNILSLKDLKVNKRYEIILTNQSGYYRYRIRDVIKIISFYGECPVIEFVYRKGQLLNITGEKTNVEQMTEAVKRLADKNKTTINEWAVMVDKTDDKYCYVLLAENKLNIDLSQCSEEFDKILIDVNPSYKTYKDIIGTPRIMNQINGTHDRWKELKIEQGAAESQIKPVRLLDTNEKKEFFLSRVKETKV